MKSVARLFFLSLACLILLANSGCSSKPTYPKEYVTKSLQELLDKESLHTSVRFIEHTVAVQVDYPGSIVQNEGQLTIGTAFDELTHKVLTAIHRVLLSSDAQVDFYVLLISDPNIPGAYITMVRYMDDVKRATVNMLDTPEFFSRTVFDLQYVGPNKALTIEQYVPRDIHLEEFLSWQLARRIQQVLAEEFKTSGDIEVGRCSGEFRNGEFAFTLNVAQRGENRLDDALIHEVFKTSTNVIARVLLGYKFNSFESVRLIHPSTGRNIVLPKARLEIFR